MNAQLIVNADDFGSSTEVNAAVAEARRSGILTSASLMVTGEAVQDAVGIARADPGLAVGLHLTLSNGCSMLPHEQIPLLVDCDGRFADSPSSAATRYYFIGRSRYELRREVEAQFEAFARTGLALSHVDGHQHLHLHPVVLPVVLALAIRYGAYGIRVPREPLWLSATVDQAGLGRRAIVAAGHAYLRSHLGGPIGNSGLASCETSIGSFTSGRMSADYVIGMLKTMRCGSVEVFFHPSLTDSRDNCGPNRRDLGALLDPRLRQFVEENGYELTSYAGLREKVRACGCG